MGSCQCFLFYPISFLKIALLWDTSPSLRNVGQMTFQVLPSSETGGCWKRPYALIRLCSETEQADKASSSLPGLPMSAGSSAGTSSGVAACFSFSQGPKETQDQSKYLENGCKTEGGPCLRPWGTRPAPPPSLSPSHPPGVTGQGRGRG